MLAGGLEREDAWQRATEMLFERLAVVLADRRAELERQQELIGRYRMASEAERRSCGDALRRHVHEHFPELRRHEQRWPGSGGIRCAAVRLVPAAAAGEQVVVVHDDARCGARRSPAPAMLEREAWPLLRVSPPGTAEDFYRHAGDPSPTGSRPSSRGGPGRRCLLRIDAPANTRALAGIDPSLIAEVARARAPVQEARAGPALGGTLCRPRRSPRRRAWRSRITRAFVAGALFLDRTDPSGAWAELSGARTSSPGACSAPTQIRLEADGTDLTLRVAGRTWINSDGRRNMPSGEVFTGPLERSAQGTVRFTVPSSPRGVAVTGVELTFRDGEVVAARAERGHDYLVSALATDEGARRLGELGVGTNSGIDRATGHILLDEKIAGTVHLALGRSYPETGGLNASALHWDLICDLRDGGRLSADGEPVVTGRPDRRSLVTRVPSFGNRPDAIASAYLMRRTKIVATIGPASRDREILARMVEAGVDVVRLNFSHATREIHAENAELVRAAASAAGRQVAICCRTCRARSSASARSRTTSPSSSRGSILVLVCRQHRRR